LLKFVNSVIDEYIYLPKGTAKNLPEILGVFEVIGERIVLYRKCTVVDDETRFTWSNPFVDNPKFWLTKSDEHGNPDTDNAVQVSLFLVSGKAIFKHYSNTDYTLLYQSLISSDISEAMIEKSILTQRDMISVYNFDTSNIEILDLALKFGDWLANNTEMKKEFQEYLLINKLQILKFLNGYLLPADCVALYELSKSEDKTLLFEIYTLLGDKNKVQTLYETMSNDERKFCDESPVFVLYEKLLQKGELLV
jgi:hypothetical protein